MKKKRTFYRTTSEVTVIARQTGQEQNFEFKVGGKMAEWYLGMHNIAEIVIADAYATINTIRLVHPVPVMSRCVVSGLTKRVLHKTQFDLHHIVPQMYLKWFPENTDLKQDLVYIHYKLHRQYEKHSTEFQEQVAKELGLMTFKEHQANLHFNKLDDNNQNVFSFAVALVRYGDKIPEARKKEMTEAVLLRYGFIPDLEYLEEVKKKSIKDITSYGKYVLEQIPDLQNFVVRYRQHFLDTMKPNFMSKNWDLNKPIYIQNN